MVKKQTKAKQVIGYQQACDLLTGSNEYRNNPSLRVATDPAEIKKLEGIIVEKIGSWIDVVGKIIPSYVQYRHKTDPKFRFIEAEKKILKRKHIPEYVKYAKKTLKGRWAECEDSILKECSDTKYFFENGIIYAKDCIKGRWPELEQIILHILQEDKESDDEPNLDARTGMNFYIKKYASEVIKGRWQEVEPYMSRKAYRALHYAKDVIGGRFELGEETIKRDEHAWRDYQRFLHRIDLERKNKQRELAKETVCKNGCTRELVFNDILCLKCKHCEDAIMPPHPVVAEVLSSIQHMTSSEGVLMQGALKAQLALMPDSWNGMPFVHPMMRMAMFEPYGC